LVSVPDAIRFGTFFSVEESTQVDNLVPDLLNDMGNLLYTVAVVLVIIWALGFFGILGAGIAANGLIHVLLVIAVVAVLLRLIQGRGV
jgi:amino acid transporter